MLVSFFAAKILASFAKSSSTEIVMLRFIINPAVAQIDLRVFYQKYRPDGRGQAAFEPSMMTALVLYAYSVGTWSSRQIERLWKRDIAFKVIAANQVPDHCTIARFRRENGKGIEQLFTDVLRLCAKDGLVKVGVVALDGAKVKGNAALDANRTYEHIEKEVAKMLTEAEAMDVEEDTLYGKDKRGDELPEDLRDRKSRLKRLQECKQRLEEEAAEQAVRQREKIEERQAEEAESGQKRWGRKLKEPKAEPPAEAKANVTDPDSKIMKTRSGYVQGYNGQAVVGEGQIIVAAELTIQENDINQLHPMVEKAQETLAALKLKDQEIEVVLANAGYCSEATLEKMGIPKARNTSSLRRKTGSNGRRRHPPHRPGDGYPMIFPGGTGWSVGLEPNEGGSYTRNAVRSWSRYLDRSRSVEGSRPLYGAGLKPVLRNGNSSVRPTIF